MASNPETSKKGIFPKGRDNIGGWCTQCNKTSKIRYNIRGEDIELCPTCDGTGEEYEAIHYPKATTSEEPAVEDTTSDQTPASDESQKEPEQGEGPAKESTDDAESGPQEEL